MWISLWSFSFSIEQENLKEAGRWTLSLWAFLCEMENDCGIDENWSNICFWKLCVARCEVEQVSHALSQLMQVFLSEWGTGIPRYEWTCSAPVNVMNSLVASWSYFLSQNVTLAAHSDNWLPGVGFDKEWFSCLLGTGRSPSGDMFTVTSVWLTRSNNRWMFYHSLSLPFPFKLNKGTCFGNVVDFRLY